MTDERENGDSLPSLVADLFRRIQTECIQRIEKYTIPILGVQNNSIVHDRTGVLYRIGDRYFILTAAHYLESYIQYAIPLYISLNSSTKLPLPLAKAVFHTTEEDGRDVAAISLPPELASEIEPHREFLSQSEVWRHNESVPGFYVFFGYPMDWSGIVLSKTEIHSHALAFACCEYTGKSHSTAFYDKAVHIQLEFDCKAVNPIEETPAKIPTIKGISGCGIWRVADWSPHGFCRSSPAEPRLVGIQNHWFPDLKYIQGTRIGFVLSLILANYPDVKPAMNLVYPHKGGH